LPHGRHGLSRAFVVQNQRERILNSLVVVCASKGYPATTVEDVTAHAGVSRRTFYDLFADKGACFLEAYDMVIERALDEARAGFSARGPRWPRKVASGLRALIELFAAEPALARLAIVEVLAAGEPALERRDAALTRFAAFFDDGRAGLPATLTDQDLLTQGVIGGLYEVLYGYILDGHTEHLVELLPDLTYCALVPYVGHLAALEAAGKAAAGAARRMT
jgi:AcrR family transcriptional regulator